MEGVKEIRHKDGTVVYRVRFRDGKTNASETFPNLETAIYFRDIVKQAGGTAARRILDCYDNPDNADTFTLQQALDQYIEHVKSYATPRIPHDYRSTAKNSFLQHIPPETPIRTITRETIETFIANYRHHITPRHTPVSSKTIHNAHGLLSSILEYQVKQGRLPTNPAKGVKIPDNGIPRVKVFLTPEQVEQIASKVGRYALLVRFLYATGMRINEATALTPADINLADSTVTISKSWKTDGVNYYKKYLGAPKTTASIRTIPIPQTLLDQLKPIIDENPKYVFHQTHNPDKPIADNYFRYKIWKPAVEKMNPRPRIHDLRHSHVSRLIQAGIPLPVIQKRVGHKDIQTTVNVYGHITPDQAKAAADVFN